MKKLKKSLEDAKKEYFKRNRLLNTIRIGIRIVPLSLVALYFLMSHQPICGAVWLDVLSAACIGVIIVIVFVFFEWHEDIDLEEKHHELKKELKENLLKIQELEKEFEDTDYFFEGYPAPKSITALKLRNEQIGAGLKVLDM